jgi:hypothetical protein
MRAGWQAVDDYIANKVAAARRAPRKSVKAKSAS